jgi:hypothetical protein
MGVYWRRSLPLFYISRFPSAPLHPVGFEILAERTTRCVHDRDMNLLKLISTAFITMSLLLPIPVVAQPGARGTDERLTQPKFVGIPLINYNRNIEFIIGGFAGLYYPISSTDSISPPSFSGLAAMYSTNGTGAVVGFTRMYLVEDFLRIKSAGGAGRINFQYFNQDLGIDGAFVNYTSTAGFFVLAPLLRVARDWYFGPDYTYLNVATVFQDVPVADERRTYSSLGVSGEYDTRPSKTYPMSGFFCTARLRRYAEWLSSASEYTKMKIEVNRYMSLDTSSVLALRGCIEAALGAVPFEAQTVVGAGKDIRGYSNGKYRGDQVYSIQGEYRWNFAPPFGAVGFLGFSLPVMQGEPVSFSQILPGIGAGFRYMMVEEIHANVGVDVAVGRDDWGLYFRIAEAF